MISLPRNFAKRSAMTIAGVLLGAFSVGMFNLAGFGVDPFQCFAQGSHNLFSAYLQYGTYYMILSLAMLAVILILDKHYIGIATFINVFLVGYIVEYSYEILAGMFPNLNFIGKIAMLSCAVTIMCFGSALYYTADLGVSVYDAISLIAAKRKIRVLKYSPSFKWIRVFNDCVCVALGAIFGKTPGFGTIITALFMGPLIAFFIRKVAEPMLMGKVHSREIL